MGCMLPGPFIEKATPYSALNYGFAFLVQKPNPDQVTHSLAHSLTHPLAHLVPLAHGPGAFCSLARLPTCAGRLRQQGARRLVPRVGRREHLPLQGGHAGARL
eukprot:7379967-Prymnesium_polylepis.1